MNLEELKEVKPDLRLVGEDGNAYYIMAAARKAARKAGLPPEECERLIAEMTGGDYNNLLSVAMKYFNVH